MFMLSFRQYLRESFLLENKAWHQFVGQHGAELLNRAGLTTQYSSHFGADQPDHGTPKHLTNFLSKWLGLDELTSDEGHWVLKHFHNGKIQRTEDIQSTVIPNLMRLRDARSSGRSNASLSKIKGPDELHGHLSRVDPVSAGSFSELDPEEYTVHGQNKHWTVVQPHTQKAACVLGKGTNWCTSADRNNRFNYYNETGPLHIFIPKNPKYSGERYQSHTEEGLVKHLKSIMDDRDTTVYNNPRMSGLQTRERPLPKEVEDTLSHVRIHDVLKNPGSTEDEILEIIKHPDFTHSRDNVHSAINSKYEKVGLAALDHIDEHDSLAIHSALHSPFESVAMKAFKHPNFDNIDGNLHHAIGSPHESVALAAVKHPRFGESESYNDIKAALKSRFKSVATFAVHHPLFGISPYDIRTALRSPHEEIALIGARHPKFKTDDRAVGYAVDSPHESVALEGIKHPSFGKQPDDMMRAFGSPHESVQTQAVNHPTFGSHVLHITYALNSEYEPVALAAINHPNFANLDTGWRGIDQAHISDALESPHESVQLKAVEHPAFGSNHLHVNKVLNYSEHPSVIMKAIDSPAFPTSVGNFENALTHRNREVALYALSHPHVRDNPVALSTVTYSPHAEVRDAARKLYPV